MNQEELKNKIKGDLAAVEAMNSFVEDSNKLSVDNIKAALETNDSRAIDAAIAEAEAIKASNPIAGENILAGLNEMKAKYADYTKEINGSIMNNVAAVDAMNFSVDDSAKLSTDNIKAALETKDSRAIDAAIAEAEAIKNSGNSYGQPILDTLNTYKDKYADYTQEITDSVMNNVAAVEAMNFSVDDSAKLSTSAIKKALQTKESRDIEAAIEEANAMIKSGNPYGQPILDSLNTFKDKYADYTQEANDSLNTNLGAVNSINTFLDDSAKLSTDNITKAMETRSNTDINAALSEANAIKQNNPMVGDNIINSLNMLREQEEKVESSPVQPASQSAQPESKPVEDKPISYLREQVNEISNKIGIKIDNISEKTLVDELFATTRGNIFNGTSPALDKMVAGQSAKNVEYDKLMAQKDSLDFSNPEMVRGWLNQLIPYINTHALTLNNEKMVSPDKYLLDVMAEKGYTPGMNSDNATTMEISEKLADLKENRYFSKEYSNLPREFAELNNDKSIALAMANYYNKANTKTKEVVDVATKAGRKDEEEIIMNGKARVKLGDLRKSLEKRNEVINKLRSTYSLDNVYKDSNDVKIQPVEDEYKLDFDDHKLNKFTPIKSFKKIGKTLYDKINSVDFKGALKTAVEKLKEAKKSVVQSIKLKFAKDKPLTLPEPDRIPAPPKSEDTDKVEEAAKILDELEGEVAKGAWEANPEVDEEKDIKEKADIVAKDLANIEPIKPQTPASVDADVYEKISQIDEDNRKAIGR